MKITLWKCDAMNQWRWTLCKTDRPIIQQFSGQNCNLHQAMIDIENAVKKNNLKMITTTTILNSFCIFLVFMFCIFILRIQK